MRFSWGVGETGEANTKGLDRKGDHWSLYTF